MSRVRNCARQPRGRQVHPATQLRCVRKPPCPPWQQIRAIQAIAQQFTALRLAQLLHPQGVLSRPLVGRRHSFSNVGAHSIHSLLTQRLVVQRPCELQLCSSPVCAPWDSGVAVAMSPQDGTRLRSPSFHLVPEHTKPPPAAISRVLRGRPTTVRAASRGAISQLVSVETPGQSRMVSRHNRERDPF